MRASRAISGRLFRIQIKYEITCAGLMHRATGYIESAVHRRYQAHNFFLINLEIRRY